MWITPGAQPLLSTLLKAGCLSCYRSQAGEPQGILPVVLLTLLPLELLPLVRKWLLGVSNQLTRVVKHLLCIDPYLQMYQAFSLRVSNQLPNHDTENFY